LDFFMESLVSLSRMQCDHEPALPRTAAVSETSRSIARTPTVHGKSPAQKIARVQASNALWKRDKEEETTLFLQPGIAGRIQRTQLAEEDSKEFAWRTARIRTMKKLSKVLAIAGMAFLGFAAIGTAQVQQSISFSFTLYNQTDTGIRAVRVGTKDVIENLTGAKVPGGKLWLVMPTDPSVDGNGTLGAVLRVTDAHGNIIAETTTDSFNLYQSSFSQTSTHTYAWNGFSLAFGGLDAELYGTAIWSKSLRSPGGQGTFHCSVSGHFRFSGITDGEQPCSGSITGTAPKPAA
jgi:hypothetical protein